jgi:tetratricopeptide (TPR) repeat protein
MRQNDAAYARKYTTRALESAPRMREALALDIAAVAVSFDFARAAEMFQAFDALSPNSPLAYYEAGKALSESRQYHQAAEYLNEAVRRQPKWPQPSLELGLLEMQSGRDTLALTALRRAVDLDPFNVRARNSLALVEDLAKYASFETQNFIIRSRAGVDEVMAREMGPILEEIHKHDMAHVDFKPPQKTVIELHPDHKTFAVRITGMTGIHTIAASTGPVIAMEAPKVGKEHKGPYDWVRVLRHEYVHTLTLARTNNRIPHWFTEASAVYLEGAPRDYNTVQMLTEAIDTGSLFDLVEINIAFVRPKKPMDRGKAYAQGHWMYQYIVYRWGERAPLDLMDLYRDGVREAEAMQRVLGIDSPQFLKDFEAWARQDAMSWGMLAKPSIPSLMLEATLADPDRRAGIEQQIARFASGAAVAIEGGVMPQWEPIESTEPDAQTIDRLLEIHPEHPDLLELKCGFILKAAGGKPDESMVPLLERYAKARPVDPMPHQHLARLYLASEDPSRAIPHLAYLDVREQYSPVYAIELARQHAALGEWDSAGLKAERATQISPFDANFREFAASVAIQRGDLATAERHIQALVDLEPTRDVHQKRLDRVKQMQREGE